MSGTPALRSWNWPAAAFVVLSLAGCAQGTAGQVGGPYPTSAPDSGTRPEHGGGNGGGGGGSM